MKKVLLGTSALALLGAASTANAADFDVKVGGYFEAFAAYADSDVDGFAGESFGGVDAKQDVEIHFKPSITLDNGLRIGADVQLEGSSGTADTIDEAFLFIRGSFGEILIGSENSAGYKMTYAAPDVTFLGINSGSTSNFVPFSGAVTNDNNNDGDTADLGETLNVGDDQFRGTLGTTFIENDRNNDAQRFTYFTPRTAGFQVGLSYARDGLQDNNAQINNNGSSLKNIFDVGANYLNSFGGFDVGVSGRWGYATSDTGPDPQIWSAGLNLGFAGVSIGGSFAEQNASGTEDGIAYDAGISYETGPWGFSFTYFHGENVDDESVFNGNAGGNDEELDQFLLGMNYKLAKGVDLSAFGAYVTFDEDTGDLGGAGDDVDGFIIGTGIRIRF